MARAWYEETHDEPVEPCEACEGTRARVRTRQAVHGPETPRRWSVLIICSGCDLETAEFVA